MRVDETQVIYARVEAMALDADATLTRRVIVPGYKAKPERILLLHLATFDWNCPQHFTPRFTQEEIADAMRPLRERVAELEAGNAVLRGRHTTT